VIHLIFVSFEIKNIEPMPHRIIIVFVAFLACVSCRKPIKPEDISKLNGYWEIENVVLSDGSQKEYKVNETIDYFEIKKNKGFRKKVKPQFDGRYLENGDSEAISVSFKNNKAFLNYKTPYSEWRDEILEVSDNNLVLKNDQNVEYHYKKAIPFNITDHGKTTQ